MAIRIGTVMTGIVSMTAMTDITGMTEGGMTESVMNAQREDDGGVRRSGGEGIAVSIGVASI